MSSSSSVQARAPRRSQRITPTNLHVSLPPFRHNPFTSSSSSPFSSPQPSSDTRRSTQESFTLITACFRSPSPQVQKSPAKRSGRRPMLRSGTSDSLAVTPASESEPSPAAIRTAYNDSAQEPGDPPWLEGGAIELPPAEAGPSSIAKRLSTHGIELLSQVVRSRRSTEEAPANMSSPTLPPNDPFACSSRAMLEQVLDSDPEDTMYHLPSDASSSSILSPSMIHMSSDVEDHSDPSGYLTGYFVPQRSARSPITMKQSSSLASPISVDDEACYVDRDVCRIDFLSELPFELALCIIYHLPSYLDALTASAVSRKWRAIALDNAVWRELFFRKPGWQIRSDAELVIAKQAERKRLAAIAAQKKQETAKEEERKAAHASKLAALKTWRETLHIPSLPDLSALNLSSASSTPKRASRQEDDALRSPNSNRFGFLLNPARGPSTPVEKKRVQEAAASSTGCLDLADTSATGSPSMIAAGDSSFTINSSSEAAEEERLVSTLDWLRLYSHRHILDQRWRRCRPPGEYKPVEPATWEQRYSPRAFEPSKTYLRGHTDSVYCVRHDDGVGTGTLGKVVSGSRDRTIRVWDVESAACKHVMKGHGASVLSLQYDGHILVSGSSDSMVFVWDFASVLSTLSDGPTPIEHDNKRVLASLRGHSAGVLDVAFDSTYIVSCSKDTTVRVYKRSDYSFFRKYTLHGGPVNAAGLQDGKVVSASGDGSFHLWSILTGETLHTFSGHERGLACIAYHSPMVVSGSNDQTIRTWDATKGECTRIFKAHDQLVRAIAYDEGRKLIASGGYDKMIKLWDVEATDCPVREIKAHSARIFDIKFDTTRVVSASEDQRVCISFFGGKGIETSLFA